MAVKRNLKVHSVLDIRTGKVSAARLFLSQMSEQEKHELRTKQLGHQKILNYACPVCDQKVYLSGSGFGGKKVYHFKHFPNLGHCPLKEGIEPPKEDLLKMMYNGAKESKRHIELKTWLGSFLKSIEHKGDFAETNIEKRITSTTDRIHWRQPDVSCSYLGKNLVFELQLNGTFVEVIRGREHFYEEEKTFICWLFDRFDPNDTDFGERDIFWLNKSNAFVITKEARQLSEEKQELFLECHYQKPVVERNNVIGSWENQLVPFSSLILKEGYYKPFYFDSDEAKSKLIEQLIIPGFIEYLLGDERKQYSSIDRRANDTRYMNRLKSIRPETIFPEELTVGFVNIIDAIKFLKVGVALPQFHDTFDNIKNYTNQILQFYPGFGYIFCMAVKKYRPEFKRDELGDKLKKKLEAFWDGYKAAQKKGAPDGQDRSYDGLIGVLFPELKECLTAQN